MTQTQKEYIEQNIDLIENNEWDKFFRQAPNGVGHLLYEVDVKFLEDVFEISAEMFRYSNLTELIIPNNITSIGEYAFVGCENLTRITIPNSVTSIGWCAFSGCSGLKSIRIPNGVKIIERQTFYKCINLKSIDIPVSVTNIGDSSFKDLGSDVVINFNGTKEQWKNIYNSNAFRHTYFTVNCLDGSLHKEMR